MRRLVVQEGLSVAQRKWAVSRSVWRNKNAKTKCTGKKTEEVFSINHEWKKIIITIKGFRSQIKFVFFFRAFYELLWNFSPSIVKKTYKSCYFFSTFFVPPEPFAPIFCENIAKLDMRKLFYAPTAFMLFDYCQIIDWQKLPSFGILD